MRPRAVVTGASRGIGAGVARELGRAGYDLTLVSRDSGRARATVRRIRSAAVTGAAIDFVPCDLSVMAQVEVLGRRLRGEEPPSLVLHCAAVVPEGAERTTDGFERQWAVNHLAPFLLSSWVTPAGVETAGRVVTVASQLHRGGSIDRDPDLFGATAGYDREGRYRDTKLANVLFARALGRRFTKLASASSARGEGREPAAGPALSVCLHPGAAGTGLLYDLQGTRQVDRWLNRAIRAVKGVEPWGLAECIARVTEVCTRTLDAGENGSYWQDGEVAAPSGAALDDDLGEWLWAVSSSALERWLP